MSNRLVRRYFKCYKCKGIESQLIHPNKFQIKCTNCNSFLNEIQEKEFKILKKSKNINVNKSNNDSPYKPSEDAFRNISSVYNRPPSRSINLNQNQNTNNINQNNRNRFNNINNNNNSQQRNRRYQSTNHYSDMNIVNDHNTNNNNNNNYFNNINNINNSNINNNQFRESQNRFNQNSSQSHNNEQNERRRDYGQGARNRERSQNPMNSASFNYFTNIIGGIFGIPLQMSTPIIISRSGQGQPLRIIVQRQNVPQTIFDPVFLSFGSLFNNEFRDNFSSNFRSNFRGNFLNEIIRIIERNMEEAARKAHPPASETALKKLKRFPLTDKYCKKDKNGKIELPSCCICLSDIEKNEETVLLPCGHMFHWNCCLNWLKGNNTCPMCRFVIKD